MTQTVTAGTEGFTLPEPAEPNYAEAPTLEEQLRLGGPADARLSGSGTLVDNGWDRWHWAVVPGTPGVLTLQLQVADVITWWKTIEVKASLFGHLFTIKTLGTHDGTKVSSVDLTASDVAQSNILVLEFYKMGFAGIVVTKVGEQILDVKANLGSKIIYFCTRDNPSQP